MSNSIWKTPDQNPKNYQSIMFITKNKSTRAGVFKDSFYYDDANNQYEDDELECWATIYDVKAQADKAERLQKAVDLAIETLKFYADGRHYKDEELDLSVYEWYEKEETGVLILDDGGRIENGKKARDAIKQLIKGE